MLTLLFRRYITVAGKIREIHPTNLSGGTGFPDDWPIDFVNSQAQLFWEPKPSTFVIGENGITDITHSNPPPVGIETDRLQLILTKIASHQIGESLLFCSRLYALELHHIHGDLDLAYQLLVSSVEAIANQFLMKFSPSKDELVTIKKNVSNLAIEMGLSKDNAEQLAVEACSGMEWATRKFVKFLVDFAGKEIWEEDDLFHLPEFLIPPQEDFEKRLKSIYQARSGASHRGISFPRSGVIGLGPMIPSEAIMSFNLSQNDIPPVAWFEHVVSSSLSNFIMKVIMDDA